MAGRGGSPVGCAKVRAQGIFRSVALSVDIQGAMSSVDRATPDPSKVSVPTPFSSFLTGFCLLGDLFIVKDF